MTKGIHKRAQAQETAEQACAILNATPGMTRAALSRAMGLSLKTASRYIALHRTGWKPGDEMPRVRK